MYSFITSNKTPELGEALGTVAPNTEPFPFKGCLIKKSVCYIITSWPKRSFQDLLPGGNAGWILPFQDLVLPHSRTDSAPLGLATLLLAGVPSPLGFPEG